MNWLKPGAILVLAAALFAVVFSGCQGKPRYPELHLQPDISIQPPPAEEEKPLRLAIASVYSPKRSIKSYQGLIIYLSEQLGRPVELVQRTTYAEIIQLIKQEDIDVALICSLPYVMGKEDFGLELLAVPRVNGQTTYRSYIIVPKEDRINRPEELRGKTIAFSDPDSFSGKLYFTYLLNQSGETVDPFSGESFYTYSHDNSIRAVVDRLAAAASVNSIVYDALLRENPRLNDFFQVIDMSPPVGNPPLVAHPNLPAASRQALQQIFLSMHLDPEGREILSQMGFDRFVPGEDSDYDYVRKILSEMDL